MREIHAQMKSENEVPAKLADLFDGVERKSEYFLVFLANYDKLLNNTETDLNYDKQFFNDLNFIKNKDNVSLLCTTCKAHDTFLVYIGGESHGNSWLTLDPLDLPPLTRRQTIAELERRIDEYDWIWLKLNPDEKEILLDHIRNLPMPYSLLCHLAYRFNNQTEEERTMSFKKRVNLWLEAFADHHKDSFNKKLLKMRRSVINIKTAAGIKQIRVPVIGGLIETLAGWFRKKSL
jgi:hypothetical protein